MQSDAKLLRYLVTSEEDPLAAVFPQRENGRIGFGIGGESKADATPEELLRREVEFRGYVMEGFVTYFVQAERRNKALVVTIRMTGSNRDQHIPWAIEHALQSQGCKATKLQRGAAT